MARFFIHHPIFAWVISLGVMLAGGISMLTLPVSQYPDVASPTITINAMYLGASAQTVEESVTQIIEQNMKGLDNLLYMRSTSDSSGSASVSLTFAIGTDPDIAQVQVQNKLQLATPNLPQIVQQQGVRVSKSNSSMFMALAFFSNDGSMDQTDLSDYVHATVKDELSRIEGVGNVSVFGGQYSMRIWLDPDKLQKYKMTPGDVVNSIRAQNVQVAAGQLGGLPHAEGKNPALNVTIKAQSLLQTTADFENILLRVEPSGSAVHIRDVARVELGSEDYSTIARINTNPSGGLGLSLASGANALATAERVKIKLEEMRPYMPQGVEAFIAMDTTPPVRVSIEEVAKTLVEAVVLVFLVMLLFLQNVRATLIPTIAVPVVLLGTFGVLAMFGYSINTLTLFGMVLAIGLLVDDAIVVVENVERVMAEEKLPPLEATEKSMGQISSSLVGIAVVLSAVFLPMAFMSGSTGVIYRQFSVTIVSAMLLSVAVAFTLTPALCATMLKPHKDGEVASNGTGFFGWFNRVFDASTTSYHRGVAGLVRKGGRVMLVYVALVACLGVLFMRLPTAYLPEEDQGVLFAMAQMPANATEEQTLAVLKRMEDYALNEEKESVASVMAISGFSFAGAGQNTGMAFISLKDWSERKGEGQSAAAVAMRFRQAMSDIIDGQVIVFLPPAIIELGTSGGFTMELQDKAGQGHDALMNARNTLLRNVMQNPTFAYARPNGLDDTSQFAITFDNHLAASLGLSLSEVSSGLSTLAGGAYVNDFIDRGRVKKVYVQADAPFRMVEDDLRRWNFRNASGDLVPFSAIASTSWTTGPSLLERFNGTASLEIQGEPAPGVSSGTAMQAMVEEVAKLGAGFGLEWSGLSYQEIQAGSQTMMLYALAVVVVFLALAALYESWSIPLAVILVLPLGVLGAVLGTSLRGLSNDVYFQVGILAAMGLAAKNAILVVEFARTLWQQGMSFADAATEAAHLRLRPIIMTSLAFGLGVLPLTISSGAGSAGQHAVGTAVLAGTVVATGLGIFFIPVFFVVVCSIADRIKGIMPKGHKNKVRAIEVAE